MSVAAVRNFVMKERKKLTEEFNEVRYTIYVYIYDYIRNYFYLDEVFLF